MQCHACGKQIADSALVCVFCGTSVRAGAQALHGADDEDGTVVLSPRNPARSPASAGAPRALHEDPPEDRTVLNGSAFADTEEVEHLDGEDLDQTETTTLDQDFPVARSSPPMRLIAAIVVVAVVSIGLIWSLVARLTSPAAAPAPSEATSKPEPAPPPKVGSPADSGLSAPVAVTPGGDPAAAPPVAAAPVPGQLAAVTPTPTAPTPTAPPAASEPPPVVSAGTDGSPGSPRPARKAKTGAARAQTVASSQGSGGEGRPIGEGAAATAAPSSNPATDKSAKSLDDLLK